MAGYRTQIKAFLLCLTLFLVSSCLPEDSTAVSNGQNQTVSAALSRSPQKIAEAQAVAFMSASRNITGQVVTSAGFSNGTMAAGEINFAAMGIKGIPANMKAAYCKETKADGSVVGQVISWMDNGGGTAFSVQGIEQNAGETIMHSILKQSDSVDTGMASGGQVTWMDKSGNASQTTNLSPCGNINIPANTPVIMSRNLIAANVTDLGNGSVMEYTSEACPDGEIGSITMRRWVAQTYTQFANGDPAEQFEYGDWEEFQNTCMEFMEQLDTGQVTIEVFANQAPLGEMQQIEISEVLSALNNTECMGATEPQDPDAPLDTQDAPAPECDFTRTAEREELDNPYGSELEVTDEIVDAEIVTHACPIGDTTPITGYVQNFPGQVDVGSGWQGTMEFARYYHNVMNMAGEQGQETDSSFRDQWQGHTLLCTRDELLNIECSTAYPNYSASGNPQVVFIPVDTTGYSFTRENVIDGWDDPTNFVPNQSLPNDQGWQAAGGNCSWNETVSFDNVPSGYTPTQPGGGIYHRLVTASDLNVTPTQGQWVGVTPSVGTRTDTNTLPCPSGFTGSIIETITYRSVAEFPWSTPVITNTSTTDNNCTCTAEIELRQTPTTCADASSGILYEERQRQCPSGNWGAWITQANSCAGMGGDPAECGPAAVQPYSSFPTTGLCSSGTPENRREAVSPTGIPLFLWDCRQADGSVAAGCSARNISTAPSGSGATCGPAANGVFGNLTTSAQFFATAELCSANAASTSESTRLENGFYIYEWSCQNPPYSAACGYMIPESYFNGGAPATGSGPICGTAVNTCINGVMQDSWDTDRYWWECRVGGGTGACDSDPNCEHCEAPFGASTANCAAQTLNANGCAYPFSAANHGNTQTVQTSTTGFVGQMNAQCSSGNWTAVTSSCTAAGPTNPGDCPAQTITWGSGCSATIPSHEDGFSDRIRSTANGGVTRYTCSSGTWVTSDEECSTIEFGCGPAGEMTFSSAPTSLLCDSSTASNMRRNEWGTYLWDCTASDGVTLICSAVSTERYDASCGSAHRSGSTSTPAWATRCDTGRSDNVVQQGSGYYTWMCLGRHGGIDVSCTSAP